MRAGSKLSSDGINLQRYECGTGKEVGWIGTTKPGSGRNSSDGKLVYVVPNYQRLYVWNRDNQWELLWSDVCDIADNLLKNTTGTQLADDDRDGVEPHFNGCYRPQEQRQHSRFG